MVIGFYTSRVVLQELGQEDYGIYNLVGGIVGLLAFLNSAMYGATSRYLTVALGKGDTDNLKKTFDSAVVVHFRMAVAVFLIAETVGLWFINTQLVIPQERMLAANVVYQTAIFSLLLNIMQVPLVSSIISHEKMSMYAYVDIINFSLKLGIVFLLPVLPFDNLISFAVLMLLVAITVFLIYKVYTARKFAECRYKGKQDKSTCRELASFFGWNMAGNFGGLFNTQAIGVLVNRFFGLVYNAANGVAFTISNIVNALTGNMMVAFTPPITKAVAAEERERTVDLNRLGMKMSLFFFALFAIPVIVEADTIMRLWLVEVPPKSAVFCRLIIAGMLFEVIRRIAMINIHASGNIKLISIIIGTLLTINPFIGWLLYRMYPDPALAYACTIGTNIILAFISILIIRRYLNWFPVSALLVPVIKMLAVTAAVLIAVYYLSRLFEPTLWRVLLSAAASTVLLSALTYVFCLGRGERQRVGELVLGKLKIKTGASR